MAVNNVPVTVTFDPTLDEPQQFEWSPDPMVSLPAVTSGSSFYALILTLTTQNAPGAAWASPAVEWDNNEAPPPVPEEEDMPVPQTGQIVIGINNNNTTGQPMNFGFAARVSFNSTVYVSTDPEVVLQPPS